MTDRDTHPNGNDPNGHNPDGNRHDDAQWAPYGQTPGVPDDAGYADTSRIDPPPSEPASLAYSESARSPSARAGTARFETQEQTSQYAPNAPYATGGFPTGPAPSSVPTTAPTKRRSKGLIAACVAAGLVLVLVIGLVGSELFIRNRVTNCLENAFGQMTGAPTSVSISRKPMLLQAVSDEIPFVQIDTDDSGSGMKLHARADGISTHDNGTTINTLTGSGNIPFERVTTMSQQMNGANGGTSGGTTDPGQSGMGDIAQGAPIQSMTGNAADGTIDIQSAVQLGFLPIPVSTTIKPILENGRVRFDVVKANAFIFGIPKDFAQKVVDQVSGSLFGPMFDEVQVQNLKVTDKGVDFAIDGKDVDLQKATAGQTGNESCSLV